MSRLRCLQDFSVHGLDALVECGNPNCRRRVVADPRKLLGNIKKERWLHRLSVQAAHMRCGQCGHKGARIAPVPRFPAPLDCDEFKADIDAMWERVMAEQSAPPFKIEGPDADGFVWICSSEGRDVWCHNLGTQEEAAEQFSQWLGSIDYQENE